MRNFIENQTQAIERLTEAKTYLKLAKDALFSYGYCSELEVRSLIDKALAHSEESIEIHRRHIANKKCVLTRKEVE